MPRSPRFTREQIARTAFDIVRREGTEALTARSLAHELGCSVKPIFGLFANMDDVQQSVWEQANAYYADHLRASMDSGRWPRYMASGMGYITFAKTEPHLFSMLFMCDQSRDQRERMERQLRPIIELIARQLGVSAHTATAFHMQMWIHVHGIAAMIVTHYLDWDEQHIVDALTMEFHALSATIANQQQGSGGAQ